MIHAKEVLDFDDLRRVSRLGERATLAIVERWAKRIGLKYSYDGRGGIWTTMAAMNAVLGLFTAGDTDEQMYRPEMVV